MNKIAINLKKVPLIMGILNVTPDSFYDGGRYTTIDRALSHVQQMVKDGADIIDVGGESTRPGSSEVTIQEEMDRVCPIVERIIHEFNIPISIDTQKSKVADEVLKLGASIVNDISGLRNDNHMPDIIAKHDAYCIIMHIRGTPQTMQMNTTYSDLLFEIKEFLMESIAIAKKSNIDDHKIIIDPGIGFGKSLEQNYNIIHNISFFKKMGYPVLIGLSRKSLIGKLYSTKEDRLPATIALNSIALYNGADIIRVHDVKEHKLIIESLKLLLKVGR
ncbi:MAG TPA: dihydropteroate synthase [Spirochaetota bacterium]|jgi:dihydropteroate synthase|nr:dihydropteroate synthase [Spirochaetota bacterium]HRR60408.1 dihydropteroate synthase [Spirochaetota bacterium]HRV14877.1 dihydropteroate synthase [Spirochaetota bacterium]